MGNIDPTLWQKVIQQVIADGGNIIRPWFAHLEPVSLEHGLVEIQAPGREEQEYCRRHATTLFTQAAQSATGRLVGVSFLVKDEMPDQDNHFGSIDISTSYTDDEKLPLSKDYSFETFVIGPSNRLAHAACLAVSESLGKTYNPLFIHGNVGLGKTHLLHATCRKTISLRPAADVRLLTCETFVNDFIGAIEHGQLHQFRDRYRQADLLVIDDIQFLSGHEQIQEEFFHTFNALYQSQKQIILTCDRGPGEIPDLEERLVSRFNWGLVARTDRPCYETRIAIVRKKARLRKLTLPEEAVCFIAGMVKSNIRELEGAITKVTMLSAVTGRQISLALAEEALGTEPTPQGKEVSIENILNAVIARYNVRLSDLQSKKRNRSIAFPRQICMYLARKLTRHSLAEIGGYFGGRDHTTVLHANRCIKQACQGNPRLQATLDVVIQELHASA